MTPYPRTDDPTLPCSLCVQWRCAGCKSTDWPDCCDWTTDSEPYWPDGSVVPVIYSDLHDECDAVLHTMNDTFGRPDPIQPEWLADDRSLADGFLYVVGAALFAWSVIAFLFLVLREVLA